MNLREGFPGLALGWAVMFSALAAQAAPPPEQTVSQWSDEHREISGESGARITGKWRTDTAAYLKRPLDCCGIDHPCASVWVRWSAKTGKTQLFVNAAFQCIDSAPRSIMIVCATDQKQKDFEREVWGPAVKATEKVRLKIMPAKSRAGDGSTTYHKRFRGGFLKIINGGSEPQLQQSDIGLLIFEEPSSYEADVGGRGSPVEQARTRQTAWGDDAKELGGGTPKFVGDCVVTDNVELGTVERFYVPCPHCGARQLLVWENMVRSEGRPYFVCGGEGEAKRSPEDRVGCGGLIGHEHKLWMLDQAYEDGAPYYGYVPCFESEDPKNPTPPPIFPAEDLGKWLARDTEGREPSFDGIWQAYSPFTTWAKIFAAYDKASKSGDVEHMVTFVQQVLARPFEAAHDRPAKNLLFENRVRMAAVAQVQPRRIPPWAWSVVGTADVQGDRIEAAAYAIGRGRRMARIDFEVIPELPSDPKAWARLSEFQSRRYEGPACRPLGFDRFCVDTGGHHTHEAYLWTSGRPNVLAIKGKPNDREALPLTAGSLVKAKIDGVIVAQTQLYLVGTHKVKKSIYHGLAQALQSVEFGELLPGSVVLGGDATERDFEQLTAEVLLPVDPVKGRKEETWERSPAGAPNEQLDLAVYAWALGWSFLPDAMTDKDWDALMAARRRDPVRDGELPLEAFWTPHAVSEDPEACEPGSQAAPAGPPPGAPAVAAGPAATPTALEGPLGEHPLMRLARLNRGDDA